MQLKQTSIDKTQYIDGIKDALKETGISDLEWENTLVIGDVHFGVKNGSVMWLQSQIGFFKQQVFPIIEKAKELNVSHVVILGDMFDVRASTNTVVAVEVRKLITEMCNIAVLNDVNIYVIAGNHDYYSPDEQYKEYNTYNAIFGDKFSPAIYFITDKPCFISKVSKNGDKLGEIVLLPWYETSVKETFLKNISYIIEKNENNKIIYGVYAHCDMINASISDIDMYRALHRVNIPFWSGHVHYIVNHDKLPLYNVGACMQYTFADADADRFIYIINEKENKKVSIKNIVTPKFSIIEDSDLFDNSIISLYKETEFVELDILSDNVNKQNYVGRIKEIRLMLAESEIRVKTVFSGIASESGKNIKIYNDIETYIEENTPANLKEELSYIKSFIKKDKNIISKQNNERKR